MINSILAVFNLIPFGIFDGAKVLRWNPIIWGITFVAAMVLAVKAYFGIY
jgi:Zn-dependent protease